MHTGFALAEWKGPARRDILRLVIFVLIMFTSILIVIALLSKGHDDVILFWIVLLDLAIIVEFLRARHHYALVWKSVYTMTNREDVIRLIDEILSEGGYKYEKDGRTPIPMSLGRGFDEVFFLLSTCTTIVIQKIEPIHIYVGPVMKDNVEDVEWTKGLVEQALGDEGYRISPSAYYLNFWKNYP